MNPSAESPVYSYLKGPSMVDYPGHMAMVLFLSGCNFTCGFCHNAGLMARKQVGLSWGVLEKACAGFRENWVNGAVVSGGEPTLSDELPELVSLLKSVGWKVKLDTNGSRPAVLESLLPELDYVAMDIKTGRSGYPGLTGFADMAGLAASIRAVCDQAADYEFRTTVIESLHSDEQMHEIGEMIRGAKRYVLQPFVPRDTLPEEALREAQRTSPQRLEALRELMAPYVEKVTIRGQE